MARPKFGSDDFLDAALAIAAEQGLAGATVAAVTARLKAPTGSFYHRFASRDLLLGEFGQGASAAALPSRRFRSRRVAGGAARRGRGASRTDRERDPPVCPHRVR